MGKLFVFGIGGTGVRVIKSLSMLLASGVSMGDDINEIVPMIIDVDAANSDLTRTVDILKNYVKIQSIVDNDSYRGFFQTKITDLYKGLGDEFKVKIKDVSEETFGNYINYGALHDEDKDFVNLLFSGSQLNGGVPKPLLEMNMSVGFQGNPKLGCVALNQFNDSNSSFRTFAENFTSNDRIFMVGSIHGGTGASGFPLLLKNIRNAEPPVPNSQLLKDSIIGAITVLPYYSLKPGDINSMDFISKAKAALEYYRENVNPHLNSLYYIGYSGNTNNYENNKGGNTQKNNAHFVELSAAMSIVDFARTKSSELSVRNGRFMEFGTENFDYTINLTTLGGQTRDRFKAPLIKYYLFRRYLGEQIEKSIGENPWSKNSGISRGFIERDGEFYSFLKKYNEHYDSWIREMDNNIPSFKSFNNDSTIFDSVNGINSNKSGILRADKYKLFEECLNSEEKSHKSDKLESTFLNIFSRALDSIYNKKYNN